MYIENILIKTLLRSVTGNKNCRKIETSDPSFWSRIPAIITLSVTGEKYALMTTKQK